MHLPHPGPGDEPYGISAGGSMLVRDAWKRFTSSQPKEEQRLILITLREVSTAHPNSNCRNEGG